MSLTDDILNALQSFGVSVLGLAAPQLSPQWMGAGNPTFNSGALTLSFGGSWKAPTGGTLDYSAQGAPDLTGLDGNSMTGNVAVLRFHPQAVQRLEDLYVSRYGGSGGRSLRPVPASLLIRIAALPGSPTPVGLIAAGDDMPQGEASFHDPRGLIIDPLAIAAAFGDLLTTFPSLRPPSLSALPDLNTVLTGDGGAKRIATLGTAGVYLHFVTPHGGPWQDPGSGAGLQISGGGGGVTRVSGAGPFALGSGAQVDKESGAAATLRWGLTTNGTLAATALQFPPFPGATPSTALPRDFLRLCAVDLTPFLLGNRTNQTVNGLGPADDQSVAEPTPPVRDGSHITFLADGVDVCGTLSELSGGTAEGFLASPAIDDQFAMPAHPTERWPDFPAHVGSPASWDASVVHRLRTDGITVAWSNVSGSKDLVLTIAVGLVPSLAHVRVFPRRFITQDSLANGPSFGRADGSAVIAPATGPTTILLKDPLALKDLARPTDQPMFHFDLLIVPRPPDTPPRSRLFGDLSVPITGPDTAPPAVVPGANAMSTVGADHRAVCSAPLLGLPPRSGVDLTNIDWTNLIDLLERFASEGAPREGPRFPTMARFDSIAAFRTGTSPNTSWSGLLSGGFLRGETLSAAYRLGNPGWAAGPEIHAPGVRVDGQLAYDLGRAAVRRTSFLVNRLISLDDDNWNEPAAPGSPSTQAAAVLQTVAPTCETPELSVLGDPAGLPNDWNGLKTQVVNALNLGAGLSSAVTALSNSLNNVNAVRNADRLVQELKREAFACKYGRRDAQWALRRAIFDARELVYIEAPAFQATAATADPFAWDLAQDLVTRLTARKNLKIILALAKEVAFGPAYASWAKQEYNARKAAVESLQSVEGPSPSGDEGAIQNPRLAVFHPMGFPGRPLNVRSTVVIVDDVWCLVGTSAPRRRGLTFDGGADVVCFDRQLVNGYSASIRDFRRKLLALHLGLSAPENGETPSAGWVRLAQPASAFAAVKELLKQGGRALIEPLWKGSPDPGDGGPTPQSQDVADPEGRNASALLLALAGLLSDVENPPA